MVLRQKLFLVGNTCTSFSRGERRQCRKTGGHIVAAGDTSGARSARKHLLTPPKGLSLSPGRPQGPGCVLRSIRVSSFHFVFFPALFRFPSPAITMKGPACSPTKIREEIHLTSPTKPTFFRLASLNSNHVCRHGVQ